MPDLTWLQFVQAVLPYWQNGQKGILHGLWAGGKTPSEAIEYVAQHCGAKHEMKRHRTLSLAMAKRKIARAILREVYKMEGRRLEPDARDMLADLRQQLRGQD